MGYNATISSLGIDEPNFNSPELVFYRCGVELACTRALSVECKTNMFFTVLNKALLRIIESHNRVA